jgi:hypothetical protein
MDCMGLGLNGHSARPFSADVNFLKRDGQPFAGHCGVTKILLVEKNVGAVGRAANEI